MKIAVSAQEQELRVHLTAAVLERPEFEVQVLPAAEIMVAPSIGVRAMLLQANSARLSVDEPQLRRLASEVPLIVVCTRVNRLVAATYLRIGARALMLADRGTKTFQSVLFAVLDGGAWIDPRILSELLQAGPPELLDLRSSRTPVARTNALSIQASHSNGEAGFTSDVSRGSTHIANTFKTSRFDTQDANRRAARHRLTGRETEVADLIGRGLTNCEIAAELFVDESTVKTHVGSILRKIRLRDRLQIALWFHGLPIGSDS